MELYCNDPGPVLTSGCLSTDTSIVINNATGLPTSGNFRIKIDAELILVTAISGTTLTCTRGIETTAAAGHVANAQVHALLTAGALNQIRSDSSQYGTYASLPNTNLKTGMTYQCSDSPYEFIYTGSVWQAFLKGQVVSVPGPSSNWTQINFGSGNVTLNDAGGMIGFKLADTSSLNWRLLTKTTPATPYHIEFFWRAEQIFLSSQAAGVYFYDGTKLMGLEILTQSGGTTIRVEKITNVTTDSSSPYSYGPNILNGAPFGGIWGRLGNSGTTLTFDWAFERGDWWNVYSETVGTFITPTQYGFGGVSVTTNATVHLTLSMQAVTVTT